MNPPNWRLTLLGVAIVIAIAVVLPGCADPAGDALEPRGAETIQPTDTDAVREPGDPLLPAAPPAGADEGNLGDPDNVNLEPVTNGRDPNWDCDPTGNTAIDDWKREAKCGGKLNGE